MLSKSMVCFTYLDANVEAKQMHNTIICSFLTLQIISIVIDIHAFPPNSTISREYCALELIANISDLALLLRMEIKVIMGMDEKLHQKIFEDNLALIDTPLIAKANSIHYPGAGTGYQTLQGVLTYPFNMSEFHQRHMAAAAAAANESPLDIIDTGMGFNHK
uniref:Uncharacterized protein n=1 Tax=Glossina austeni TaxID=7395 RepID=A0A1A9UEZ2_GLOAU